MAILTVEDWDTGDSISLPIEEGYGLPILYNDVLMVLCIRSGCASTCLTSRILTP